MSIIHPPKRRAKRLKSGDRDYVSNKDLFDALVVYLNELAIAREKDPNARVEPSDYIVHAIMLICQRRLRAFNFAKYDFKDEMLGDGLIDCFKDLSKFKPSKSENPFSYFTTIANNAFIRRIKLEKAELYGKYALIDECILFEDAGTNIQQYGTPEEEDSKNEFMRKFEKSQKDVKEKAKMKKLEKQNASKKSLLKRVTKDVV